MKGGAQTHTVRIASAVVLAEGQQRNPGEAGGVNGEVGTQRCSLVADSEDRRRPTRATDV